MPFFFLFVRKSLILLLHFGVVPTLASTLCFAHVVHLLESHLDVGDGLRVPESYVILEKEELVSSFRFQRNWAQTSSVRSFEQ